MRLCTMETATVLQQLHYRWKVGDSTDERMATIADAVPRFIQKLKNCSVCELFGCVVVI